MKNYFIVIRAMGGEFLAGVLLLITNLDADNWINIWSRKSRFENRDAHLKVIRF